MDAAAVSRSALERARGGDKVASGKVVEPFGHEPQADCYGILGSVPDGEGTLQETFLAARRRLGGFQTTRLRACLALPNRHNTRRNALHDWGAEALPTARNDGDP
jgi:DNA-directed RNA polymerase specialized sigma24 family protein